MKSRSTLRSGDRPAHRVEHRRRVRAEFGQQRAGGEDEHAGVPQVPPGGDHRGGGGGVRLFDEAGDAVGAWRVGQGLAALDIAVAGFRRGGLHAECHHLAGARGGDRDSSAWCSAGGVGDGGVGGHHPQHRVRAAFGDQQAAAAIAGAVLRPTGSSTMRASCWRWRCRPRASARRSGSDVLRCRPRSAGRSRSLGRGARFPGSASGPTAAARAAWGSFRATPARGACRTRRTGSPERCAVRSCGFYWQRSPGLSIEDSGCGSRIWTCCLGVWCVGLAAWVS